MAASATDRVRREAPLRRESPIRLTGTTGQEFQARAAASLRTIILASLVFQSPMLGPRSYPVSGVCSATPSSHLRSRAVENELAAPFEQHTGMGGRPREKRPGPPVQASCRRAWEC